MSIYYILTNKGMFNYDDYFLYIVSYYFKTISHILYFLLLYNKLFYIIIAQKSFRIFFFNTENEQKKSSFV
jgi:hypothetical protein